MQPVTDERFPGRGLALGNFIFVMRKDEVFATAMDVERLAEVLDAHRTALDVPPRPTRAPRRVPFHIAVLLVPRLPEREIGHLFLVVVIAFDARNRRALITDLPVRKLAVFRKRLDRVT